MLTDYDEISVYQELKFLYELVEVESDNKEKPKEEIEFDKAVERLKKYFEKVKSKIDFINVDVSDMFTFLNK